MNGEIICENEKKKIVKENNQIIKVFNKSYSKADILNEALNQARVEETDLYIPKVLEVKKIDDQWAIVSEYIEGVTLDSLMKKHPEKMDTYLDYFIKLQLNIQTQNCYLLNRMKEKLSRKISESNLSSSIKYELHTRLEGMLNQYKLCHGDFNPTNIVLDKDKKPYIVDWSHTTQGNGAADAAITYLYFCLNYSEKTAQRYLDKFVAKSEYNRKVIQKWLPIMACALLSICEEKDKEYLAKWASVVEME